MVKLCIFYEKHPQWIQSISKDTVDILDSKNHRKSVRKNVVPGLEPMSYSVISFPSGKGSPEKAADLILAARNISRNGLGIGMPGLLPKGTVLEIELPDPVKDGTRVPVKARVTWCIFVKGQEFQAGLEFMTPGFKAREAIDALIRTAL